jgi:cytochrome d ubiquinol oxidase subunit I
MDAIIAGRIQFATNITFHILFPTINISLAWILLFFKLRYNKTQDQKWMNLYELWVKIFAICFALGIVSGVTMSFQFGTNWAGFMEKVGNIAGPLLAYEVVSAFFLEATFLGIMLYGRKKVSNRVHTVATSLVAIGTSISAFWILVLNSWMHTPSGHKIIEGKVFVEDWMQVIFNPSMPYRISHMVIGSALTSAFLIAGISAYQILLNNKNQTAKLGLKFGSTLAAILIPIQIIAGDLHGLNTLEYQPAKIAAMEGIWETEKGAGLRLFALPDEKNKKNHFEVTIPKASSLILTHSLDGEIKGLKEFGDLHPPVAPLFFSFRLMVGMGFLMLLISWASCFYIYRKKEIPNFLIKTLFFMTFSGWIGSLAGWYTTEIGRQPWLVQGILKTSDAVTKNISGEMILSTLFIYIGAYLFLTIMFIWGIFYLARKSCLKIPVVEEN